MPTKQTVASLFAEIGVETRGFDQGSRQVQGKIKGIGNQLKGLGGVGGGVLDGLGMSLGRFAGPAALGLLAVGLGKTVLGLEQMGEESAQQERRFVGLVGGAQNARAAIAGLDASLGLALTKDEKMAAATKILGLGLAKNATEAATMAKQAAYLGDTTQSAGERIDGLTDILVTGRLAGLREYGISAADVEKRVLELRTATKGLSEDEAKGIAIREALASGLAKVEEAGGTAITPLQGLSNAWADLKDAAADRVNLSVAVDVLTKVTKEAGEALAVDKSAATRLDLEAGAKLRLADATQDLALAQARYAAAVGETGMAEVDLRDPTRWLKDEKDAVLAVAQERVRQAQAEYDLAVTMTKVAQGVDLATDAERAYVAQMDAATSAALENASAERIRQAALGMRTNAPAVSGTGYMPSSMDLGTASEYAASSAVDAWLDAWRETERAGNAAAKATGKAWSSEINSISGDIKSMFSEAQSASLGLGSLLPGGEQGMMAPGANGPFEAIYRLQSIATHGLGGQNEQDWAAMYGVDQESARSIVEKFQQGLLTPDVTAVIDKGKLAELAGMKELAAASQEAFAAELAAVSGEDPKVLKALLGMGQAAGDGKGEGQAIDLGGFIPGFLSGVDKELKDNEKDLAARGEKLWTVLGGGFIKSASESPTFAQAVSAMVAKAIEDALK